MGETKALLPHAVFLLTSRVRNLLVRLTPRRKTPSVRPMRSRPARQDLVFSRALSVHVRFAGFLEKYRQKPEMLLAPECDMQSLTDGDVSVILNTHHPVKSSSSTGLDI